MSERVDDDLEPSGTRTDAVPRGGDALPGLMGSSDEEALLRRLERAARDVAAAALEAERAERRETEARPAPDRPEVLVVDASRVRLLQWILAGTLVAMALAVFWPVPAPVGPEPRADGVADPLQLGLDGLRDRRDRGEVLGLPNEGLYQEAMLLGARGDYEGAIEKLGELLADERSLPPSVSPLIHGAMAYYLRRSRRIAEALEHERLAMPELRRTEIAQSLIQEAREAMEHDDPVRARRVYARFLLMQDNLSPGLRQLLSHAWIEIGDSYRAQAGADLGTAAGDRR